MRPGGNLIRPLLAASLVMLILLGSVGTMTPTAAEAETLSECPAMTDSIERLYSAYFLRSPDSEGFAYWSNEFAAGRWHLERMSDFFAASDEFVARYSSLDNSQFVSLIYSNVLGRPAEPEGHSYWLGQLDSGARSRGNVMINFSESGEYVTKTRTAPPLAGYFNSYPEGARFSCGFNSFSHPSGSHSSVDVLAVHQPELGAQAGFLDVSIVSGKTSDDLMSELVPYSHIAIGEFTGSPQPSDSQVRVSADEQITVYVVSYDGAMPRFAERSGWREGERPPSSAEFAAELSAAESIIDTFWANSWSTYFTGTYIPPTVVGLYDGTRPEFTPTCGGIAVEANNALYCGSEHYLAWDVNLLSEFYVYTDAFVYLVIAHEWGHAIQGQIDPDLVPAFSELQADCLAGAALYGSASNALKRSPLDNSLIFEPGDEAELEAGLAASADDVPWADPSSHGSAEQRIAAFGFGRDGGVEGCFE